MYSADSSDISFPASGSRLLSESPLLPSGSSSLSQTGPGGDDLSISELSLSDRTALFQQPFSLLARPYPEPEAGPSTPSGPSRVDGQDHGGLLIGEAEQGDEDDEGSEDPDRAKRNAAKLRDDKLQSDIFILKKLNASFALFNDALEETGSANERIAEQLEQTDALLNKYVNILARSEQFSKLIFDENWEGGEADEDILIRERREAMEKARLEAEERALRAQREVERQEKEEQERQQREEKERLEGEKKERLAARGGIKGVRGTRASMRGTRGTAPPTTARPGGTAASQSRVPSTQTQTGSGGSGKRPSSSAGRGSTASRGATRGRT